MIDFKGRTVLVTGGGAGIGRAVAEAFGQAGARIVIAEIRPGLVADARESLKHAGIDALVVQADMTREADVRALAQTIDQRYGSLDVLVNNVGDFVIAKRFEEFSDAEIDQVYALNMRHVFSVTRAMIPLLRRNAPGSSIISISSIEALRGAPTCAAYSAFKAAIGGFSRSLALELGPEGIRVNVIAPETTETPQVPVSLAIPDGNKHHIPRWIPLGRFGQPSDCAGAALYLASPLASWVTGITLSVDGGALAAGGWTQAPGGVWTVIPVITGTGFVDANADNAIPSAIFDRSANLQTTTESA
ncbi:MAG: SDR family oxidoreductase [Comamonas sp.]|jgi:NAD(P)-dependent dehydrogenase (short-subunit alcohol dehydrogenase family)|uniref:SDR family NAD(P)-dependent oxidoreductase n=1 Tax=Comamonas sp. TaxID=34028 RepID=UPI0012CA9CF5|nr:SDR family NAD(P)-dependent oxidoreductase [Comamonas sp.]MDR3065189.1 SDR family oxidoreductase [Comamonas sp.]MPS92640.1 SDR family oxidoreductase [Comamonas sp.]